MKFFFPRVIQANRGDISSRWGIVSALKKLDIVNVVIAARSVEDIPKCDYLVVPYGPFWNLIPRRTAWSHFNNSEVIVWAGGLDLQDDSSKFKILYILAAFSYYRLLNKRVLVLCQGAGPIQSGFGRFFTKQILKLVDVFVARDPGTMQLLKTINPNVDIKQGYDGIFFPGFDSFFSPKKSRDTDTADMSLKIGINIRQWFHFSSQFIPYRMAQASYREKARPKMESLLVQFIELIDYLLDTYKSEIVLFSAYHPGIEPWEDDLYYLRQIKESFQDNDRVQHMPESHDLGFYFRQIAKLDLMIGMRLHSTLTALRLGVPSINISYTKKGRDILAHLGLGRYVVDLEDFLLSTRGAQDMVDWIFQHYPDVTRKMNESVNLAVKENLNILDGIFSEL